MIANPFNRLLRAPHTDTPPANSGASATADAPATETAPEGGDKKDDEPEPEPEPENPEAPETPAAAVAPVAPKLNAFQRGSLRALGVGGLTDRVEKAEGDLFLAQAEVSRLTAENLRLTGELTQLRAETPAKIEAAAKGRENQVQRAVTAELSALGVTPESAPSQISAEQTPEALLEKFNTLKGAEKTAFFRANRTALKAAESAKAAK